MNHSQISLTPCHHGHGIIHDGWTTRPSSCVHVSEPATDATGAMRRQPPRFTIRIIAALTLLAMSALTFPLRADDDHQHSRNTLPKQQHRDSDAPFLKPAEAVARMAVPGGFEVSVFASEPDIAEPIAFCFDDRGRPYAASASGS